jgi:hypothetical protein
MFIYRVVTFPVPGLSLSLPQSGLLTTGTHQLVIRNISRAVQGNYVCQVTYLAKLFNFRHICSRLCCQVKAEIIVMELTLTPLTIYIQLNNSAV